MNLSRHIRRKMLKVKGKLLNRWMTPAEVAEGMGISPWGALQSLRELQRLGTIEEKGGKWRLVPGVEVLPDE